MDELFANIWDPGQMPQYAVSDLGLPCLPVTRLGVSSLQRWLYSDGYDLDAQQNFLPVIVCTLLLFHSLVLVKRFHYSSMVGWVLPSKHSYIRAFTALTKDLVGISTLSGETTLSKLFCIPSKEGSILKGNSLLPVETDSFFLE